MRIDWNNEPRLGQVPDAQLARALGVGKSAVHRARTARGILATAKGKPGRRPPLVVQLSAEAHDALRLAAEEAGLSVAETTVHLLEAMLFEDGGE
jgi:hypothetical protein